MKKQVKVFLIVIAIIIVCILTYIAGIFYTIKKQEEMIVESLESEFSVFQTGDVYLFPGVNIYLKNKFSGNKVIAILMKSVDYEIIDKDSHFNTCNVTVKVKTKDFKTLIEKIKKQSEIIAAENIVEGEQIPAFRMQMLLEEYTENLVKSDEAKDIESTIVFKYEKDPKDKEGKRFILKTNMTEIEEALIPGYGEIMKDIIEEMGPCSHEEEKE